MFVVFIALSVIMIFGRFQARNQILIIPWALTGLGVILSFKRHLWIAVMVSFLLILYMGRRRELHRVVFGSLVILFFSLLVVFFLYNFTGTIGPHFIDSSIDRLTSLFRPDTYTDPTSSLRWRDFEYEYGIPQFLSHPIFGLGLGAKYRPYIVPKDWEGFDGRGWIHNGNLWLLVKTGLLGFLPLITVILSSLYRGFKSWRLVPETWKRYLAFGCALSILGMLIGSFIEPTWMRLSWTAIIGIILGVNEILLKEVT
jgi:O-antigen ligase